MFFFLRGSPKFDPRQGVIKFLVFPEFIKSPTHPTGGRGDVGQENCGLFPLLVTFFNLMASLIDYTLIRSFLLPEPQKFKIATKGPQNAQRTLCTKREINT